MTSDCASGEAVTKKNRDDYCRIAMIAILKVLEMRRKSRAKIEYGRNVRRYLLKK